MNQQVNLYQPMFRPQRVALPAVAMAQILALAVVALGLLYAYAWWQLGPTRDRVDALQARLPAAEQRLANLRREYPTPVESPALRRDLQAAQQRLAQTREIATKLRSGAYGTVAGLSPYLEGFARQHVEGMWLTRVRVRTGGRNIGLDGKALVPELVPTYIDRLSGERAFEGTAFSALELHTDESGLDEIGFSVRTSGMPAEEDS